MKPTASWILWIGSIGVFCFSFSLSLNIQAHELTGLLQIDQVLVESDKHHEAQGFGSSANIRAAQYDLDGDLNLSSPFWQYHLGVDFAAQDAIEFNQAFIAYSGFEGMAVHIGQIKTPFTMNNNITRGRYIGMEPALPATVFSLADSLGLSFHLNQEITGVNLAIFVSGDGNDGGYGSDLVGVAGRLWMKPNAKWHVGVSAMHHKLHAKHNTLIFSGYPELYGRDGLWPDVFVSTSDDGTTSGLLHNTAKGTDGFAVEAIRQDGPLTLSAEYIQMNITRRTGYDDRVYKGWYANASYMITGESKRYDFEEGVLDGVHPDASCGAWDLFAQYSMTNLRDSSQDGPYGPIAYVITAGSNWYLNDHLRLTAEYVHATLGRLDTVQDATGVASNNGLAKRGLNMLGFRIQADWQ